jgi:chemotaxis protein CheX
MTMPNAAGKATEAQATGNGKSVTPRSEWRDFLREATLEVFSTMVGVTVHVPAATGDPPVDAGPPDGSVVAYVTGMIGIAGAMRAVLSLRCSDRAATRIASQMLAISVDEAASQMSDAVGEVCNMIAGHFKHKIGYGDSCNLTVPTVVVGGSYSIHCLEKGERQEFPVTYEGGTVLVTLDIRS